MKKCTNCQKVKPFSEFWKRKQSLDGLQHRCRECLSKRFSEYRKSKRGIINQIYRNQVSSAKQRGMALPEYSIAEFYDWIISKRAFHRIYNEWVNSGYKETEVPSCDRVNDRISYRFDNIRVVAWKDNWHKIHDDVKSGRNTKRCTAVDQLSLDGRLVQRHHSMSAAARSVKGSQGTIWKAVNNQSIQMYGYRWRYSLEENDNSEIIKKSA